MPSAQQPRRDEGPSPLLKIVSDGGGAFGLSDALFVRWWRGLPADDKDSFGRLDGDELLAKFVCAYDFLSSVEEENTSTLVRAYAIATGLHEESFETKQRAARAWEHPAARELLARLQGREFARSERRILRSVSALLEDTLEKALADENMGNRQKAIDSAVKFLNMGSEERKGAREIRSLQENEVLKKELVTQREEHKRQGERMPELTGDVAAGYVRSIIHAIGKDKVIEIIEHES
jgi:hypothetical protein